MPPDAVALVCQDPALTADVRRLCAAVGQDLHVITDQADMRRLRRRLAVLLVDATAPDFSDDAPPGAEVIVLTARPEALDSWRAAVRVGARQVLTLPQDSRRLLDALALAQERSEAVGPLVGVMGGSGGVGASTYAAALAWAATASGRRSTLVDLDPLGGGADLLLGLEGAAGLRWPDLSEARGVVPAAALHERLPRVGQLAVVSCGRAAGAIPSAAAELSVAAATAVIAAARRGDGAVVTDLPRWPTAAADAIIGACDVVVAVVSAEVRAIASAVVAIGRVAELCDDIRVVLRGRSSGRLGAARVGACLGRPVEATVAPDPRLAAAADRGELAAALARSQLGAGARDLWPVLVRTTTPSDSEASGAA